MRVCEGACVYACSTCVYAGRFQTACLYWKAQEGDLSDKMVCIVCSINMPTFLNLPSCKRCWRLKQATHYSCMRALRALLDSIVKCGFSLTVAVCPCLCLCVAYNRFIVQPGAFSHSCCCRREKMTLTQLLGMIKGIQLTGLCKQFPTLLTLL